MDFAEVFPFNEVLQDDIYNYVQENDRPDLDKAEPELVKESQGPRIGLTTKQATHRIIAIMNDTLSRCESKVNLDVLLLELFKPDLILNVIAFLLLLSCLIYTLCVYKRSEYSNEMWEYIMEVIMYFPWIMVNLYVKIIIKLNKANKKGNRIREILNFLYISGGSSGVDMEYKGYNMDPPSSDFVPVYRDMEWVRLPRNVLVKGDIFKLQLNQVFPCDCKLVLNYKDDDLILNDEIYREGSICLYLGASSENEKFIDGTFLALNDSFTSYLETFIATPGFKAAFNTKTNVKTVPVKQTNDDEDGPQIPQEHPVVRKEVIWNYNDNYIFLNNNNKMLILVMVVVTVILNIFWNFMYDIENKIVVLVNLTRLLILFEFVGFEPVQKLSELWGNVKLLSIFEIYHEHRFLKDLDPVRSLSSSSFLTNSSYDSVSSDLLVDEITFSFQFKQLSRVLQKGLFEEGSLIRQMSCITLLCFIDDIGILLNSNQSLQEISIITSNRGPGNQDDGIDVGMNTTNISSKNNPLMNRPKEQSQEFQDRGGVVQLVEPEKEKDSNTTSSNRSNNVDSNSNSRENGGKEDDGNHSKEEEDINKSKENKENEGKELGELKNTNVGKHLEVGDEEDDDDDLLILDIFNDINLYGKDNIRFTNEYEKSSKNLLKPLIFSMSLTSIPTYIPFYTYPVHNTVNTNLPSREVSKESKEKVVSGVDSRGGVENQDGKEEEDKQSDENKDSSDKGDQEKDREDQEQKDKVKEDKERDRKEQVDIEKKKQNEDKNTSKEKRDNKNQKDKLKEDKEREKDNNRDTSSSRSRRESRESRRKENEKRDSGKDREKENKGKENSRTSSREESQTRRHREGRESRGVYGRERNRKPSSLSSSFGHGDHMGISRDNSFRSREAFEAAHRESDEPLTAEQLEKQRLSQQILRGEHILGKNRLYKNYISMLINNELDNFNNCLCTLTNVLGIKKLYLKRYKLLKFILFNFSLQHSYTDQLNSYRQGNSNGNSNSNRSNNMDSNTRDTNNLLSNSNNSSSRDRDKEGNGDSPVSMVGHTKEMLLEAERQLESGDDSKILIYFYRDVNKKVIQMLIKCKISIINNYKLNYYNGRKINSLNKRIKRKIKDLNIQWLSNGMNTFFYFYKPISINDFNILLLLLPYITVYNISSTTSAHRDSGSSSSSGSSDGSGRTSIIRKNDRKNIYMYMYKNNHLYYKYKGINILQLSKIYRSQGSVMGDDSSREVDKSSSGNYGDTNTSGSRDTSRTNNRNLKDKDKDNKSNLDRKKENKESKQDIGEEINAERLKEKVESGGVVRENRYKIDKDIILGSYIGEMLNSYIKNSILLGMVGTKYNLPKEISNRINDLHEAGIRFVYFSKHNEKITRIIGGLLGLETSWNSMISLSTSETSSFINQEGHMVLPNGINNIRQHIQQVDDIPLQVSLFCNCNCNNIKEMLDILNENGENIMCIGSGLNPNNFYLFNNSHLSFSISLNYNPICKFCKGKRWQGISKAHIFEEPKPEFKLSSLITSLSCSLQTTQLYKVSDPDFVFEMMYELFKEARNISTNLQECTSFMLLSYYSLIWMFFLQHLFSLPPIFTTFDLSMIVFVYVPYLSLTLISNPVMDKIMEHLPNKVTRKSKITYKNFVRTYLRLLVMSSIVVLVYYTHIYYTNSYIIDKFGMSVKHCSNYFYYPRLYCVDQVISYLKKETDLYDPHICLTLSQNFTSISFVIFLVINSLSWINKYSYINLETFTNVKWIVAVVLILTFQISIVVIKLILLNLQDFKMMKMMIVNSSFTLLLTIPILAVDQVIKIFIIKDKNTQQKFLQLLFSTRLGTWSPK